MSWRDSIRQLSPRSEFLIVIGSTFGINFVLFLAGLAQQDIPHQIEFNDARLLWLLTYEVIVSTLLVGFLYVRGSRPADFNLRLTRRTFGMAGFLFAGFYLYGIVMGVIANAFGVSHVFTQISFQGSVSLPVIFLVSVINPVFEEVLTIAYVMKALRPHGAAFAIGTSAWLRLVAHAYQGPLAAVVVFPLGIAFGMVYWRTRELWPLILTHGLIDLVGLLSIRAAGSS
ncbi:MAG: CPBP family intramembrane glutamic endopeptidase [Nitrospirota bacterium]